MWFKIDDGFYDHPKVLGMDPKLADAAVSLWTRAGSWAGAHTDGHVPRYRLNAMRVGKGAVEELVKARLWHRVEDLPSCAGCMALFAEADRAFPGAVPLPHGDGYVFHEWLERNPAKAQVDMERAKTKARVAKSREKKRATAAVSSRGLFDATTPDALGITPPVHTEQVAADVPPVVSAQVTPGVAAAVTPDVPPVVTPPVTPLHPPSRNGVRTGAPTRPDPITTEREKARPDVERLIDRLSSQVTARGGTVDVADSGKWHGAGEGLLDADRHSVDEVIRAIDFSQQDEFWRRRVHTLAEVRTHWNKLHDPPSPAQIVATRPARRNGRASVRDKAVELDQLYAAQAARAGMGDLA